MQHLAINGGPRAIEATLPSFRDASGRTFGQEELDALNEVIKSGKLSFLTGTKTAEFERAFAERFGVKHAVAVANGTAALHTAVTYLNPEPGDEIILSPVTDVGTVIPIIAQLAIPVFADVDPITQNIDAASIEMNITSRTRAIMVTHVYGHPADMDAIMAVARKHDLFVIEDCAQAHLAYYKGKLCGTIGDIACFSFQQSKHMTTGDGGMVISNEDERFGRGIRHCSDKGWPRERGGRDHLFLATNYHMTELQAAVGVEQLKKLDQFVSDRITAADRLTELLSDVAISPVLPLAGTVGVYFFYSFRLDPSKLSVPINDVMKALVAEGIDGFIGYPGQTPLYKYPVVREHKTFGQSGFPFTLPNARQIDYSSNLCPDAEQACRETVCMWWTDRMKEHHLQQIASAIRKVVSAYLKSPVVD
ncbi:aminotransferase class V-fold PLP-dependent enzyme [Rhizobium leguminosarum bv. viciae]|uniref:Aminotransferase class V-fold PLP-dependent enzyme n=1 Tax=Rhizobium leguminosarum bv. viciae TaxID=387 RepID=A0A8I2GUN4_RHILV|nr:DegT/DnrJ/EryC1/StrS family aminotransferase [Rhizobium leguminosarum]MBY5419980.1 DegT/DnrJ/EryC1/StrS family aminotransferase [Rhizobium leguminosarum]MBY5427128.1 DegT/DnrJ/EryC1/StrS family aminotransferase [Rhizobium leguminosarum]MBY5793967.1 DegT/DnrJ/EryC1/StrS family aminotransferase [Rhizobium leguminosarum]NKK29956.1 aminotransferase class V-fold PLP-dependent enzyme [Rhizobium leguminosarum bv. viciae]NKK39203.1 aminotransferase class V-fold PLP-dependent enzyme [Rhizobium legum